MEAMSRLSVPQRHGRVLDDYMLLLEGGLDNGLGSQLIDEFANGDGLRPSRVGHADLAPDIRRSRQVNIPRAARQRGTARARSTARRLQNSIHDWMSSYCEHVDHLHLEHFVAPKLIRYDVGDFFSMHADANDLTIRTVSAVALLPSDFDGGELEFFDEGFSLNLEPGDVCLFPSSFLFPHVVTPVTRGSRYSIVTWMR